MKNEFRKDGLVVVIGRCLCGKSNYCKNIFPNNTQVDLNSIREMLFGVTTTKEYSVPCSMSDNKEYETLFSIVKQRASIGLFTHIIGLDTNDHIRKVFSIANQYNRPVYFMVYDVDDGSPEKYYIPEKEKTEYNNNVFRAMKNFVVNNYRNKTKLIYAKNKDNYRPNIILTDHFYEQNQPFMVVGDLHGDIRAYNYFRHIAKENGYTLYFVGDLIDYGLNSEAVLKDVLLNNYKMVLGNHENNLINLTVKGADKTSLITAFTYKKLIYDTDMHIDYYISKLKTIPHILEVDYRYNNKFSKYYISHYAFTVDPYGDKTYQFRDSESYGGGKAYYQSAKSAIQNTSHTHIFGHMNSQYSDKQIELNLKKNRDGTMTYRAVIVKDPDNPEIINFTAEQQSCSNYPVVKGVDDINMFPALLTKELHKSTTLPNDRYKYLLSEDYVGDVYDSVLRTLVSKSYKIPTKHLSLSDLDLKNISCAVVHRVPEYLYKVCAAKLPEDTIMLTTNYSPGSYEDKLIQDIFTKKFDLGELNRYMPKGMTFSFGLNEMANQLYYIGTAKNYIDNPNDTFNCSRFMYRASSIRFIKDRGVVIPHHVVKTGKDIEKAVLWMLNNNNGTETLVVSLRKLINNKTSIKEYLIRTPFPE